MIETLLMAFFALFLFSAAIAGFSAAPWLPTKAKDRAHLLGELQLTRGQKVVDLGCGDGSLLFAIAKKFPDVKCVGYDISLLPLVVARSRRDVYWKNYRNVQIKFGNLYKQSLKDADVVFVFLLSKSYPRLVENFKRDLKDDALVVVEAWPLPNVTPIRTLKKEGCLTMYFYSGQSFRA